jgi:hypothetical protein
MLPSGYISDLLPRSHRPSQYFPYRTNSDGNHRFKSLKPASKPDRYGSQAEDRVRKPRVGSAACNHTPGAQDTCRHRETSTPPSTAAWHREAASPRWQGSLGRCWERRRSGRPCLARHSGSSRAGRECPFSVVSRCPLINSPSELFPLNSGDVCPWIFRLCIGWLAFLRGENAGRSC